MSDHLARTAAFTNSLDEDAFQALYGPWDPLLPDGIADLLAGTGVRWYIAGGRAARAGAAAREHEDTDLVIRAGDLGALCAALAGRWHVWENHGGTLRPVLPGYELPPDREQFWLRRDARQPWQVDLLLDRSPESEWVFKRDDSVRLPWQRALHTVAGIRYLRPEVALLHKAHLDRPKDRDDLSAAVLEPAARAWLTATLRRLGHEDWARLAEQG